MTQDHPLLTAIQVASELNTSAETVRRWEREGRLHAVTLPSGRKRYRRSDIDALLNRAAS